MLLRLKPGLASRVIGWDGKPITLDDLPGSAAIRWTMHRKVAVVAAVRGGLLSLEDALRRYSLSPGEFAAWETALLELVAQRRMATARPRSRPAARRAASR